MPADSLKRLPVVSISKVSRSRSKVSLFPLSLQAARRSSAEVAPLMHLGGAVETKLLNQSGGLRTFAVVFRIGDDPVKGLEQFARDQGVSGAQFTGIGALSRAVIGYFDWERKDYERRIIDEQVEVLTLAGNIGRKNGAAALHAHIVLGRRDGTTRGGHLLEAAVRPTLEVIVLETPAHLSRRLDETTGLALIDLSA
jgi:predicted DNA-binding protein with PD1-like motif